MLLKFLILYSIVATYYYDIYQLLRETQAMLTGFQIRAAIGVLKTRVTDLSRFMHISRFTIATLAKTPNTEYLKCHTNTLVTIEAFFKENNILFFDPYSISLDLDATSLPKHKKFTVFQLRAARAALSLSLVEFSKLTLVSAATLCNLEKNDVFNYVKSDFVDTELLRDFFIIRGLSFPNNFTVRINE